MRVLLTGACGYIGSVLHPFLVGQGHEVLGYDNQLPARSQLTLVEGDIRNIDLLAQATDGCEAVIHLACMSNNDWCEANPLEADSINQEPFPLFLKRAKHHRVRRFIFASSVAAYGNSETELTEEMTLKPTTLYGKYKKNNEQWIIASQSNDFACVRVRSASVCGPSPTMRHDVTVNKMVHDAFTSGKILVNGGSQIRSHIHINDLCQFYALMLAMPIETIRGQAFNLVSENQAVLTTARIVSEATDVPVETREATDARSYAVSGEKAGVLGYTPRFTVEDAVRDLCSHRSAG